MSCIGFQAKVNSATHRNEQQFIVMHASGVVELHVGNQLVYLL
jgi:hypothetical protein